MNKINNEKPEITTTAMSIMSVCKLLTKTVVSDLHVYITTRKFKQEEKKKGDTTLDE